MTYRLGIDLGTTYTAAAVFRDGQVQIASLGNRAATIPSVMFLREDGTFLVGDAADRRAVGEPERVAREFKRRLGDSTPLILGSTPFAAEALTSKLLRHVVDTVIAVEGGPPDEIGITHPANWGPYKIDLMSQAVRMAEVYNVTFLTEPEAAAIYYASNERVEVGAKVAVYDLGGGTFDVAILEKRPRGFRILGTPEGIERLGGIDFDHAVLSHVNRALDGALDELDPADESVLASLGRLRQDCVEAKEGLSNDTDVAIPVMLPGIQTQVRLTRAEFEAMIRPTLQETIGALNRALRSASIGPDDINVVLLVGGSSRIPLVAQLVSAELGRPVAVDAHPKHSIAYGAALAAEEFNREKTGMIPVIPAEPEMAAQASTPPPPSVAPVSAPASTPVEAEEAPAAAEPVAPRGRPEPPAPPKPAEKLPSRLGKLRVPLAIGAGVIALLIGLVMFWPFGNKPPGATPGGAAPGVDAPAVVAHRGGDEKFPLQTLPSFADSARAGVPVETDVRWTADGVAVLVHDSRTPEDLDCGPVGRLTVANTQWATLRQCRTAPTSSPDGKSYGIASFKEAVDLLKTIPNARIFAEAKVDQTDAQAGKFVSTLTDAGMIQRSVVTSFEAPRLRQIRAQAAAAGEKVRTLLFVNEAVPVASVASEGLWAVAVKVDAATPAYVRQLQAAGLKVMIWTIDSTQQWAAARLMHADMVLTDLPHAYQAWVKTLAPSAAPTH